MNRSTNRTSSMPRIAVLAAALACLVLVPAVHAQDVAEVRFGSASVDFAPVVEYGSIVLTVSGPDGFHHRAEFSASESPSFSLFDGAGGILPDGSYKYELRVVPTNTQRRDWFEGNQGLEKSAGMTPKIQSGSFGVRGGALVDPGIAEPGLERPVAGNAIATKDIIHNDDVIITQSACVGFDCVNGESFGFDTFRLKENNLRIHFWDTSVGSFPSNDWRIIANDSANGGASYLAIEDSDAGRIPFRVEAGAPSNSLYVDSAGDVGMGTSTPAVQLHVRDGNTPTLRLEQDGSSGFSSQTYDVAGNETNFFIRDVTNGSKLPFRLRPGAPTSSIDVAANGNVGIGTASPSEELDIKSRSANQNVARVTRSSNSDPILRVFETTSGGGLLSIFDSGGNEDFRMSAEGDTWFASAGQVGIGCTNPDADLTVGGNTDCNTAPFSKLNAGESTFTVSSSRTMKENLEPISPEGILEKIERIGVYEYDFIGGPRERIGLMAEDFHQIFGRGSEKMLSGQEVQMAMWLALQELIRQNDELRAELEKLRTFD